MYPIFGLVKTSASDRIRAIGDVPSNQNEIDTVNESQVGIGAGDDSIGPDVTNKPTKWRNYLWCVRCSR